MRSFFLSLFLLPLFAFAGMSQISGKWSPDQYIPTLSVQEHYDKGYQALYENDWNKALKNFMVILYHFEGSPFYLDALFYSGICYYFQADFDLANKQFDQYLTSSGKLKHFEKVFEFKYHIADYYQKGWKKHLFGKSRLPKWSSGKGDALVLLDEIIAALPGKDLAAQAFFTKSEILRKKKQYRESIECLQTLARRFPKHTLAADSYVKISEIYYEEGVLESQNPDLIALAKVNLAKFTKNFPGDERILLAQNNLLAMQETYAKSLYDTGRFYERKSKLHASVIYYEDAIAKYPDTEAARKSRERLAKR